MGKKARRAITEKVSYLVTVGEKEKAKKQVAIRARDSEKITTMDLDKFISKIKKEIETKTK